MNIIRRSIEILARNRIIRRKILVAGKTVELIVTPDAQLKYLKLGSGAFDRDLIEIAERFVRAESNVWDIGANVGVFTFAAASIVEKGTVLAVEADIWLASILRRSCGLKGNIERDIRVLPAAISAENSVATFLIAQRGRASNALEATGGRSQMGGVRERQFVPTVTLDRLLDTMPAPDFVKIDVEGAELIALQGAKKLIGETRPRFYIEVSDEVASEVVEIFKTADYQAITPQGDVVSEQCPDNAFFIPSEDLEALDEARKGLGLSESGQ